MGSSEDAEARARKRVGTTLVGKWTIERLLGVGGMAAVYAARHRNAHTAALKILHRELSCEDALRARFLREGYAANTVGHPGAVRVLDDDVADDGSVFLVMELLEGETLDARAQRHPGGVLSTGEVLWIADRLLDVLVAAHAKGIVHRDIKPENLFLTKSKEMKVLDFGIARMLETASATATQTGTTIGTPAFMAPEQAMGKTQLVGPPTDLWAVGATMFHLLTGRFVHDGESANEVLIRAATQPAPLIRTLAPGLPVDVAAIVDRALAFDIANRFHDADELQAAIRLVGGRASQADLEMALDFGAAPATTRSTSKTELAPPSSRDLDAPPPLIPELPRRSLAAVTDLSSERPTSIAPPPRSRLLLAAGGVVVLGLLALVASRSRSMSASPSRVTIATPSDVAAAQPSPSPSASTPAPMVGPTAAASTTSAGLAPVPAVGIDALPAVTPASSARRSPREGTAIAPPPPVRPTTTAARPPRTGAPASVFDRQD